MKFLSDMGISQRTVDWLRSEGFEAIHLREQGLQRLPDPDILQKARAERRILLTVDLDFGYLLAVSGMNLPSVILFRLSDERAETINRRLREVLAHYSDSLDAGAMITVTDRSIRVRHLPIL